YDKIHPQSPELIFWGLKISAPELRHFFNVTRSVKSAAFVLGHLASHLWEIIRRGHRYRLVNGAALIGRLVKSAFYLGIPLWLSSAVRELIVEGNVVRGAIVMRDGKPVRVTARRGVVLACGGFAQDAALLQELLARQAPEVSLTMASA